MNQNVLRSIFKGIILIILFPFLALVLAGFSLFLFAENYDEEVIELWTEFDDIYRNPFTF